MVGRRGGLDGSYEEAAAEGLQGVLRPVDVRGVRVEAGVQAEQPDEVRGGHEEEGEGMSNYNSENTTILATHEQSDGNTRMLLLHECDSGRLEYVIGSYFTETRYDGALGYDRWDYSWDWGHYFGDGFGNDGSGIVNAVDYWKREVLGEGSENGIEG